MFSNYQEFGWGRNQVHISLHNVYHHCRRNRRNRHRRHYWRYIRCGKSISKPVICLRLWICQRTSISRINNQSPSTYIRFFICPMSVYQSFGTSLSVSLSEELECFLHYLMWNVDKTKIKAEMRSLNAFSAYSPFLYECSFLFKKIDISLCQKNKRAFFFIKEGKNIICGEMSSTPTTFDDLSW